MTPLSTALTVYFTAISLITIAATALDKLFAKKNMRRISEKALIILALLGGSPAEYVTMRLIRHKTLHRKFMLGLPLIMLLQLGVIFILAYLYTEGIV